MEKGKYAKRIGIDARLYFQTGVGVYLRNFLHYLGQMDTADFTFFIYASTADADRIKFPQHNFILRKSPYRWHSFGEQTGFWRQLSKDKLDLMHFTYFSHPVLYRKKYIATIHDTIPIKFKTGRASTLNPLSYKIKHRAARLAFRQQLVNASRVITPTETVKKELMSEFGGEYGAKIIAVPEGVSYEFLQNTDRPEANIRFAKGSYFMYIGNFYPHKNVERLIRAFSQVKTDKKLVLLGGEDYFERRLESLVGELGQKERIFFHKPLNSEEIASYYRHAAALVHPSLAEGFCLPLLEAAYFHTPIIGSNIEVFREVIGYDYLAFDPYSSDDITDKLNGFLSEARHREAAVKTEYSFEKMTAKILELYLKA